MLDTINKTRTKDSANATEGNDNSPRQTRTEKPALVSNQTGKQSHTYTQLPLNFSPLEIIANQVPEKDETEEQSIAR